jgi:transcriptional regulator with XRE-family HTH domain
MDNGQRGYIRLVADNTHAPNRIRELREAVGLSQAELARRINVTPPALQKVEIGARKLDQQWMRRIAKALEVSPAELLPTVDNPWGLSDEEKDLIARLRQSKAEDQEKLLKVADVVLEFRGPEKDAA